MTDFSEPIFPPDYTPGYSPLASFNPNNLPDTFTPRPATIHDVHGMSTLINEYAQEGVMLARGPQYLYQGIREYSVITIPAEEKIIGPLGEHNEIVIAVVSLHILWEDLAEVRSLAVHPLIKRRGLGKIIVDHLKEDAKKLGIKRLFTFTLRPDFFQAMGFKEVERSKLPAVVWAGCSNCPKFYKCDEIGMLHYL